MNHKDTETQSNEIQWQKRNELSHRVIRVCMEIHRGLLINFNVSVPAGSAFRQFAVLLGASVSLWFNAKFLAQ